MFFSRKRGGGNKKGLVLENAVNIEVIQKKCGLSNWVFSFPRIHLSLYLLPMVLAGCHIWLTFLLKLIASPWLPLQHL